ncbi:MAG: hypothetical protein ACD_65C00006G0001, partial [uncultured bacterium]
MNLNELTIREAHDGLKAKKFSSEELTNACLRRISERNPTLNAFIEVTSDIALAQAKKVDKEGVKGMLSGIPIGIKDIFCVKGMKTTGASKILDGFSS